MAEEKASELAPFVQFRNMRDILAELEESRVNEIATKVDELIRTSLRAGRAKLDGLAGYDKKDGGKDCGKDGKEGKDESEGKETCDPDGSSFIYGDPARVDQGALATVTARNAARLQALLAGASPVI